MHKGWDALANTAKEFADALIQLKRGVVDEVVIKCSPTGVFSAEAIKERTEQYYNAEIQDEGRILVLTRKSVSLNPERPAWVRLDEDRPAPEQTDTYDPGPSFGSFDSDPTPPSYEPDPPDFGGFGGGGDFDGGGAGRDF